MKEQPDCSKPSINQEDFFINIRLIRRPWFEWVGWLIWFISVVFFLQNAVASGIENERRAAILYWIIFGILILSGIITNIMRNINLSERIESLQDPDESHSEID